MISKILSLVCIIGVSSGAPQYRQDLQSNTSPIPILSQENVLNPDGSYRWSYQTGNGIQAEEQGYLKNAGVEGQEAQVAQGSYSYTADDGTPIQVTYIADENGFRAQGAHLPTPPPIPPEIQASLDLIAKAQAQGGSQNYEGADNSGAYQPEPTPNRQYQRQQLQRQNQAYYKRT